MVQVPEVEITWFNYFLAVVLTPISPLITLFVFIIEQASSRC